jgi:hypothetical protein
MNPVLFVEKAGITLQIHETIEYSTGHEKLLSMFFRGFSILPVLLADSENDRILKEVSKCRFLQGSLKYRRGRK